MTRMPRLLLAIAFTTCALCGCRQPSSSSATSFPSPEPFTEVVHGREVSDEYRWMERSDRAGDVSRWLKKEGEVTRAALAALPERDGFLKAERAMRHTHVVDVFDAGDVQVFRRVTPADRVPKLLVRAKDGSERVLVDPNIASGAVVAINNVSLSPDGRRVAVHTAPGGSEIGAIQVYDVASGEPVGPPIDRIWGEFPLTWLNGDAVAYTRLADEPPGGDVVQGMTAYMKTTLGASDRGIAVLGSSTGLAGFPLRDFPSIRVTSLSNWVMGLGLGAQKATRVWVSPRAALEKGQPRWVSLADLPRDVTTATAVGDSAYLLSTATNPYGSLLRQSLPAAGSWAPVSAAEGDAQRIFETMVAVKSGLYVTAQRDGVGRLFFIPTGTTTLREVDLPFEGQLLNVRPAADETALTIGLQGWLSNTVYYRVDDTRVTPLRLSSETWPGASKFTVRREEATSADGTKVPLVILLASDRPALVTARPTLLLSYGSYGISVVTPSYEYSAMPWLARGGVLAYCGTRGGGERGRAWHDAGRGARKVNAQADLIACAEHLRKTGIAPAVGVVASTASAGGTLEGPAMFKRPDLFAAVVLRVAILNATRLAAAQNGANQFVEFGDPGTADGYAGLLVQDAYEAAATAMDLPDTVLHIGINDQRVEPWMTAKFAARLRQKFGSRRTIWVRVDNDSGHGVGTAEESFLTEAADVFAFAWSRSTRQ
jgi:prolyl oligopeptidase